MESDHRVLRDPPCSLKAKDIGATHLCRYSRLRSLPRRHSLVGGLDERSAKLMEHRLGFPHYENLLRMYEDVLSDLTKATS